MQTHAPELHNRITRVQAEPCASCQPSRAAEGQDLRQKEKEQGFRVTTDHLAVVLLLFWFINLFHNCEK